MKNRTILILSIIVIVILLGVVGIQVRNNARKSANQNPALTEEQKNSPKGYFALEYGAAEGNQGVIRVGKPFTVQLVADTGSNTVSDYDAVLQFDGADLKIGTTRSLLEGFTVAQKESNGTIFITGYRNPMMKTVKPFQKTPLLSFDVVPAKTGVFTISLVKQSGTGTTKYIDESGTKLVPALNSLRIVVVP